MNKRLTRDELEKLLKVKEEEIETLENTIYERESVARKDGYQFAMREIIELLHDIFGKGR